MNKLEKYLVDNPKKYLIFDFDETIAKVDVDWEICDGKIADVCKKYDPEYERNSYSSINVSYNIYVKRFGKDLRNEIIEIIQEFENMNLNKVIPNPEIVDFIKLNDDYKMYIYSNNSHDLISHSLEKLGILNKFSYLISRENINLIKPEVDGLKYLEDIKEKSNEYLFIGDSDSDKDAAKNIRIDFFLIDYFK